MKTQNKQNRSLKLIAKVILGFIVGISFGFGVGKFIKTDNRLTSSIEKTIQQNCDCELVEKDISSSGIQFSKKDGVSNKTASFILKNCKYEGSEIEEAQKLNEHLKASVENYEAMDLIELSFQSNKDREVVKIKNGFIL